MSDPTDTPIVDETPAATPDPVVEPAPVDWMTKFWAQIAADAATYQTTN